MSGMEATEVDERLAREAGYQSIELGQQIFVFVAPERLQMPDFRDHVKSFSANVPIPYCVIDEAHCVSEWGHDFRPAYLNVGRLVRAYCVHDEIEPSLMALTGTASRNVIIDIMRELDINDQESVVEPKSFDRSELGFDVCKVSARDRMAVLAGKLRSVLASVGWRQGQPTQIPSGLIFTYFKNDVPGVANELRVRLNLPVEIYSGSKPQGVPGSTLEWQQRKLLTQSRFKRNQLPVLVCTHGFGMGIDKPDIRFTIHTMLPRSLEEFYQQAGRAGRDRSRSKCLIIFADDQPNLADEILDTERTSLEDIKQKAEEVPKDSRGDAIRNTWFLTHNFLGRETEKTLLQHTIDKIILPKVGLRLGDVATFDVSFSALPDEILRRGTKKKVDSDDKQVALEKALYRLLLVGAIADYMKDYSRKRFRLDLQGVEPFGMYAQLESYLKRYVPEGDVPRFIPRDRKESYPEAAYQCGCALIDYVYETIEKRRRRAIGEMLETARNAAAQGPDRFREELLRYLEESKFTKPVVELASRINPVEWFEVLSAVLGVDDVGKLLGACRRQLEESPSHPGLLLLAGVCRTASPNPRQGPQDLRGGFISLKRYYPKESDRLWVATRVVEHTRRLAPSRLSLALQAILQGDPSTSLARFCYAQADSDSEAQLLAVLTMAQGVAESLSLQTKRIES
jgi:ATP-dependent DNA helicase RecQ